MNTGSAGHQGQALEGCVLREAATKAGVSDVCPSSFHVNTANLEWAESEFEECKGSQHLDVCPTRSQTLMLQVPKICKLASLREKTQSWVPLCQVLGVIASQELFLFSLFLL